MKQKVQCIFKLLYIFITQFNSLILDRNVERDMYVEMKILNIKYFFLPFLMRFKVFESITSQSNTI